MFNDIKAFLISFFEKLRSKKFRTKFLGLIVICLLTVLIPLSIGICYFQFAKDEQKIASPEISVSLFTAEGKLLESATVKEDIIDTSPLANIFYKLSYYKTKVSKPPEFAKKQSMSFTVRSGSETSAFKCYFEESASSSYLEDENGSFYSPDSLSYSAFLTSEYAENVYAESAPPMLCTPLEEAILPNETEWTYTLSDGTEKKSQNYETTQKHLTYRIAGAISFNFSRIPDACNITVKDLNEKTIFSGSPKELTSLTVEENSELLVSINAKWEKLENFKSYGKQFYEFKIICSEPSTFHVNSNEAFGGQLLVLSVSDVNDVNSIIYTPLSEPPKEFENVSDAEVKAFEQLYSYKPLFVKKNSNAYALLPIPAGISDTSFTFSLSCGISKEELTVKLKAKEFNGMEMGTASLTSAQKAEFSRIIFHLKHSTSDILLPNESFLLPTAYGFTQTHKYNENINNSFLMLANSYTASVPDGISVRSANVGTVSAVGNSPLLGNYVIVDHGMGLCTWYCGLSDVSVEKNDILKKGDPLGRAGSSSLLCENGVNIICSVGSILIDPDELISKT